MAIVSSKISVGTSATKLIDVDNVSRDVLLHAKGQVHIGNGAVTTSGYLMDNGDKLQMKMQEGEQLWAIAETSTSDVYVFVSKID